MQFIATKCFVYILLPTHFINNDVIIWKTHDVITWNIFDVKPWELHDVKT